jgi:hypothetical protein
MEGEKRDVSVSLSGLLGTGLVVLWKLIWLSATAPFRKTVPWDRFPRSEVLYWLGLVGIAVFSWVSELVSGKQPPSLVESVVWGVLFVLSGFVAAKTTEIDVRWRVGMACSTAFIALMSIFGGLVDSELTVGFDILVAINMLRFIAAAVTEMPKAPKA